MNNKFDIIYIGGGPAGYTGSIRASQLKNPKTGENFKVACVEKGELGGTCLNVGCIPSKALLESSAKFELASHGLENFGLELEGKIHANLEKIHASKEKIIQDLRSGISFLLKSNNVTQIKGEAQFKDKNTIIVSLQDGSKTEYSSEYFVISTGSVPLSLKGIDFDGNFVISSDHALFLKEVPKKIAVVGAGVIGLELGSVWSRLGSEVTVFEYMDKIMPTMDSEVGSSMLKILEKQGLKFELGVSVKKAGGGILEYEVNSSKEIKKFECNKVLVAIGRGPNTKNLGLEKIGIELDERGRIKTNFLKTSQNHIFAVGDLVVGPMLAHKAEEEGVMAAEMIAGQKPLHNEFIPSVIYTHPEVASIGLTEDNLKSKNLEYNIGKAQFSGNGRAKTMRETEGFVKLLCSKDNNVVYGAHIVHAQAGTLINELSAYFAYHPFSPDDIALTCHSHPDLNEAIRAAALDALGRPLQTPPRKQK
jgi:dihydrolipoamide dehydrogenase